MKYMMIKVLEDFYYNIFYNTVGLLLYIIAYNNTNINVIHMSDVEDASHCLFSFLNLTF